MELWEVFKELEAKPDRTFRTTYDGRTFEIKNVGGWFQFNLIDAHGNKRDHLTPSGAFNNNVKVDMDWQLVHEPVTWQEAIQAWAEGKKISYSYMGYDKRFDFEDSNCTMSIEKIKNAEWYVED